MQIYNPGDKVETPMGHKIAIRYVALEYKRLKEGMESCDLDRFICESFESQCSLCELSSYKDLCYKYNKNSIFGPCKSSDRWDNLDIVWAYSNKRDRYIGESFIPNGSSRAYIVEESSESNCVGCCFNRTKKDLVRDCKRAFYCGDCSKDYRDDGKDIIFKRVDKNSSLEFIPKNYMKVDILRNVLCDICPYDEYKCDRNEDLLNPSRHCILSEVVKRLKRI